MKERWKEMEGDGRRWKEMEGDGLVDGSQVTLRHLRLSSTRRLSGTSRTWNPQSIQKLRKLELQTTPNFEKTPLMLAAIAQT